MPARILHTVIFLVCISLATAGCVNLGTTTSPATRFYLLESVVETSPGPPEARSAQSTTIGIQQVAIPAYLDRPQVVTRVSGNTLRINEFDRWAEPLDEGIGRVIEENLRALTGNLPGYAVSSGTAHDATLWLALKVLRFDADTEGRVTIKAVWRLLSADAGDLLQERVAMHTLTATSDRLADVVRSMSLALATLSRELVSALPDMGPEA